MIKHWYYLYYILRHKWFVFLACCKIAWDYGEHGIIWRGIIHDISKFYPSEWLAYTEWFYGVDYSKNLFNMAWLLHQHRNPHHWQYWLLHEDDGDNIILIEVPKLYLMEMVADWIGAGRAITGKYEAVEWYLKNRQNILIHRQSREWIEYHFGITL